MKVIMYHYVRPAAKKLPFFRYLRLDDFTRQLDWFASHNHFLTREEFTVAIESGRAPDGLILTFDDGLVDHYEYVLPVLIDRGLFALFYVCTAPLERPRLLDVHRIHLLLGRIGGQEALRRMYQRLDPTMLGDAHIESFRRETYSRQQNDHATTLFKRTLNYLISYEHREHVLDDLFQEEFSDEEALARAFYLDENQIRQMDAAGMVIGSHSVNHYVFSKLPMERQSEEISRSFETLAGVLRKPVTTFCYPYGGRHSFSPETMALLAEAGSRFSFDVSPRDVTSEDLTKARQALPRYDCNIFPHGKASMGSSRASQAA